MYASKMVSICLVVILLTDVLPVLAQPTKYDKWSDYQKAYGKQLNKENDKCKNGGPIRDLCEHCSKVTKNEVAYPLCCVDKDEVRSWCKRFLNYKFNQ